MNPKNAHVPLEPNLVPVSCPQVSNPSVHSRADGRTSCKVLA